MRYFRIWGEVRVGIFAMLFHRVCIGLMFAATFVISTFPLRAVALGTNAYTKMAPVERYLSENMTVEIALAQSAAPKAIADKATILQLTKVGYQIAVEGTNGFVCLVERSWNNYFDNLEFWNAAVRAPTCYNAAAARSVLPAYIERTKWVMGGLSSVQIESKMQAAIANGSITSPEPGAMCFMMSISGHLGDEAGQTMPHLMFFVPRTTAEAWGANVKGSPITSDDGSPEPLTIFFVPVAYWSDGTLAKAM